jgi:phosphoglycerol transferase MdoB-like AlkP superfamily enzyme
MRQSEHIGAKQEAHMFLDNAEKQPCGSVTKELIDFFSSVLSCLIFWLCFFQAVRSVFLLYHFPLTSQLDKVTILNIFLYGLYVDTSTSCYLLIVPYLFWFLQIFRSSRIGVGPITIYTFCMVTVVSVISTADMQIYKERGVKLDASALEYLQHPREAAASMASSPLFYLSVLCLGLIIFGLSGIRMLRTPTVVATGGNTPSAIAQKVLFIVLGASLIFLGIRGGVGPTPMNPSFAYFSNNQFANHASLNTVWNLLYDVKHHLRNRNNQIVYMPDKEMRTRLARITARSDNNDTEFVLNTNMPNIICILLESWTADVIQSLGGISGLTPHFENLVADGLLFTNIYSSGNRTSYGLPSVLSGFPSTPDGAIMNSPQKMEKLPVISMNLSQVGYSTAFYYGGDDRFDNMRAYFMHAGFEKTTNKDSFSTNEMGSKWGAHDHVLYGKLLSDLRSTREPFFVSMLTLSSHEPYEVPMKKIIFGSDETSLFKNAMIYADRSLGDFFKNASKEPWFKNTLFILVADHGHRLPLGRLGYEPEKFHIPLLLYGEVLQKKFRGTQKQMIGSQTDIAATVLNQLKLKHDRYEWSNNLLNKNRSNYALYNFKDGFGWCSDGQTIAFDNVSNKIIFNTKPQLPESRTSETLKNSQAFMQNISINYSGF